MKRAQTSGLRLIGRSRGMGKWLTATEAEVRRSDEVEALALEMEKNEKFAEAAYEAMYDAKPFLVKDSFDDAWGYFAKAIELAKRAGLKDEAARLTVRRDHMVSVYHSQFRGVR
jgi:hypothetical protein